MRCWALLGFCVFLGACAESRLPPDGRGTLQGIDPGESQSEDLNGAAGGEAEPERASDAPVQHRATSGMDPRDAGSPVEPPEVDAGAMELEPTEADAGAAHPSTCVLARAAEPATLTVPTEYATIQQAIEAAQPFDTVQVLPGTYSGSIQLKTGVRLIGSGAEATILDGGGRSENLIDFTGAHDVVVSGFTLQNVGQGEGCARPDDVLVCAGDWYASAVYADGHSVWDDHDPCNDPSIVLSDNVITGNYVGVMLYFWPYADVRNNVFAGNRVAFAATAHGGATSLVAHNIFVDNAEAMAVSASFLDIVDNVFAENGSVLRQEYCQAGKLQCNIVWNNDSIGDRLVPGQDDNLHVDPQLETSSSMSYGFAPGSPAIDRPCATDPVPTWYEGCGP